MKIETEFQNPHSMVMTRNILIVDDRKNNLILLEDLLTESGYNVVSAINGKEALEKLHKENKYDLIISDVLMPVMDGFMLCKIVKRDEELRNIPFVFFTASFTEGKDEELALKLGAEKFIRKPFEPDDFLKTVHDLLIDVDEDRMKTQDAILEDDNEVLSLYNERLVKKLEKKVLALENEIVERKKMEEALLQSEKLKSIGIITAGISHEFNNILAIISGNVQLLEIAYEGHGDLTDALRNIRMATDDGSEISDKMLEFTNISQDTKEFVPSDIREMIEMSIDFTKPRWKNMAQAKGIKYHIEMEGMKSVLSIMCNPTEIREIFINIINNALDAMPEGGSISFRTWSAEDSVFVGISDTGEGMSKDVKKYIFDPFFTTKTPVGTGLGMSMAYGIITRHGGNIEVESELGKGSMFTLQFPIATTAAKPIVVLRQKQEANERNLRILVVDDEEAICAILDRFLSKSGHKVKTVDNGADAINATKVEDFDLVLCDLVMPGVLGHDVIKTLHKLEKKPKIGLITGWGEKLSPIDGRVNVDFIIKKPFDFSKLTKKINGLRF